MIALAVCCLFLGGFTDAISLACVPNFQVFDWLEMQNDYMVKMEPQISPYRESFCRAAVLRRRPLFSDTLVSVRLAAVGSFSCNKSQPIVCERARRCCSREDDSVGMSSGNKFLIPIFWISQSYVYWVSWVVRMVYVSMNSWHDSFRNNRKKYLLIIAA